MIKKNAAELIRPVVENLRQKIITNDYSSGPQYFNRFVTVPIRLTKNKLFSILLEYGKSYSLMVNATFIKAIIEYKHLGVGVYELWLLFDREI